MFEECGVWTATTDDDGRRTTQAYLSYKLTNEPSAQVSYKENISVKLLPTYLQSDSDKAILKKFFVCCAPPSISEWVGR